MSSTEPQPQDPAPTTIDRPLSELLREGRRDLVVELLATAVLDLLLVEEGGERSWNSDATR
jgi:hypothetical protein